MMDLSDLPPGCEDYVNEFTKLEHKPTETLRPNLAGVAKTKAEQEIEEHLLGLELKLNNGGVGNVLCREERDVTGTFIYLCIPCGATCTGEGFLQMHIQGKKHKNKLSSNKTWSPDIYKEHPYYRKRDEANKPQVPMDLEKPAGDEDFIDSDNIIVGGIARLQEAVDKFKEPLVGLEYLVELRPSDDIAHLNYLCTLCDKMGNDTTIFNHLTSFSHRSKFIDVHFPKASNAMLEYKRDRSCRTGVGHCVERLVRAARQLAGPRRVWVARIDPTALTSTAKEALNRRTRSAPHAREHPDLPDTDLSHLVDHVLIRSLSANDHPVGSDVGYMERKSKNVQMPRRAEPKPKSPSPPRVQAPKRGSPKRRRTSIQSISSISSDEDISGVRKSPSRFAPVRERNSSRQRSKERIVDWQRGKITTRNTRLPQRLSKDDLRYSIGGSNDRRDGDRPSRGHQSSYADRNRSDRNDKNDASANLMTDRVENKQQHVKDRWYFKPNRDKELRDRNPDFQRHKLDLYKTQLEGQNAVLQAELTYHEKNPEKHPLYPDEWKKFWNRRYKEIQAEGKDAAKHDFKPEWVVFWTKRMKELYELELEEKKRELCRKLSMPGTPPRLSSERTVHNTLEKHGSRPRETHRSRSPLARNSPYSRSPTQHRPSSRVQEQRPFSQARNSSPPKTEPPPKRDVAWESWDDDDSIKSVSPNVRDLDRERKEDQMKKEKDKEKMWKEEEERYGYGGPPPVDDDPVSLLRLLSALENYLGSLGPKIVDLLTLALKMEKTKPNSSEKLFQNEDNAVLLDTVKEKLKGQLQTGLVEKTAVGAARGAVTRAAAMLHAARSAPRPRSPPRRVAEVWPSADKVYGLGADIDSKDKAAVAAQIAAALVARGKKNVSPQELAKLVEAVVGAAKAAKAKESETTSSLIQNIQMTEKSSKVNTSALQMLQSAYDDKSAVKREVSPDAMDGLSDADLQTLLQNFKDLSSEEQRGLIAYLKKLEAKEPRRVERLRQFVSPQALSGDKSNKGRAISPLALRSLGGSNPLPDLNHVPAAGKSPLFDDGDHKMADATVTKVDSDDDDDYTLNDIFKSAERKVQENKINEEKKEEVKKVEGAQPTNASTLLANLLGMQKTTEQPPQTKELPPAQAPAAEDPTAAILRLVQSSAGQNLLSMLSMNSTNLGVPNQAVPLEQQLLLAQQLGLGGQLQQQLNLQQPLLDAGILGDYPMGQPMGQPMGRPMVQQRQQPMGRQQMQHQQPAYQGDSYDDYQQDYQQQEYRQDDGQYYSNYETEERYEESGDQWAQYGEEEYTDGGGGVGYGGIQGARGRGGYDQGYDRGGGYNQGAGGYSQMHAGGYNASGVRGKRGRGRGESRGGRGESRGGRGESRGGRGESRGGRGESRGGRGESRGGRGESRGGRGESRGGRGEPRGGRGEPRGGRGRGGRGH